MENTPQDYRQSPVYWFGILDIARERSDFGRAAEAQQHLHRLGVDVRFILRPKPGVAK